ncbi:LIN9 [Cordylochernes scorpioides]|uniref:LIN9 n=1 Tax=Cordylochernes scorpioides TaxID=51811 RepID=A0ABY6LM52_9ARAC|nr:LIN9 [Cordylochernes scorpioides]
MVNNIMAASMPPVCDEEVRRSLHRMGAKLKNLLKLPKAHKWVCYEWFYSSLDRCLFLGDSDFTRCLKETFPQLRTMLLTRTQWCQIRRCLGKPRRCSSAFFEEERASLRLKRTKIRLLQQNKYVDLTQYRDLPSEIPLPLVIGTKVTARLRSPQDGLFVGSVDAVDLQRAYYRITFDRQGVGTHSIPDFEVVSLEPPEMMPLSAFALKPRHVFLSPNHFNNSWSSVADKDLGASPLPSSDLLLSDEGTLGGFPKKMLILLVRLSKILTIKKEKLTQLKQMNTEGEKLRSYQQAIPMEFQKNYASTILEFERLNKDLNEHLVKVQTYCQQLEVELKEPPLQQHSREQAEQLVTRFNHAHSLVKSPHILDLVINLTSVLLQIKSLAEPNKTLLEFKSLSDTMATIQSSLEQQNVRNNNTVELPHCKAHLIAEPKCSLGRGVLLPESVKMEKNGNFINENCPL